ncbi:MAG: DUF6273 domain-containing protein [Lachnospiraceae bacterium]|nr:DUF6273 domain-containing protein [Lachnospiraceae bacterium]
MRKMKGGLALLSAAVMTFSALSGVMVTALPVKAAATVNNPRIADDGTVTWDKITFGSYPQDVDGFMVSPIKWRILDIDSSGNAFLLADEAIDCKPYNENGVEKTDEYGNKNTDYSCTWETSTIRDWLNGTDNYSNDDTAFINAAFSDEEQAEIIETTVVNEDNLIYGVTAGNDTEDKIYLLSIGEASTGEYGFDTSFDVESLTKIAKTTNFARMNGVDVRNKSGVSGSCYWWLRTPGSRTDDAASVDYFGKGDDDGNITGADYLGVRPVLHVNLSAVTYAGTVTSSGKTTEGTNSKKASSEYKKPEINARGVTTWDCVYFGNYKQKAKLQRKPIEWRVLSVNGNDAFVMADREIDCKPYNEKGVKKIDGVGKEYIDYSCTWETCTLRDWLNGTDSYSNDSNSFIKVAFSNEEREAIIQTEVINDNNSYDTAGCNVTVDKVYILSADEASNVSYGFEASFEDESKAREAKVTDYAYINGSYRSGVECYKDNCYWWFRTPGFNNSNAVCVDLAGSGCESRVDEDQHAIRPVLQVDLASPYVKASGNISLESSITKEDIETQNKANEVINLISAIGEVTKDKKTVIDTARKAYDALPNTVKAKVLNYTVLKMAESKYAELIKDVGGDAGTTPVTTQAPQQVKPAIEAGTAQKDTQVTKPKKVKIASFTNKSGKKLYVKWKILKNADGYEISIATKKNFKKGKKTKNTKATSYTFSELKKNKTYFIRVRAFIDNNGKKVYGKWSAVKKVKIKK